MLQNNCPDIETFIFIHDSKIINDFDKKNKFTTLPNVKYVFVGNKEIETTTTIPIIVSRDLSDNIENYPKLTAFTGWYTLYKHKHLLQSKYINLFEYDINYTNFERVYNAINDDIDIVGYLSHSIDHPFFIKDKRYIGELLEGIQKEYNINTSAYFNTLINKYKKLFWIASTNTTWKTDKFIEFMEWVDPLIKYFQNNDMAGHIAERSFSIYMLISKLKGCIVPEVIRHLQLDSHQTDPLMVNTEKRFEKLYTLL